ncbi:MAG: ATP-dependent DNA helicase [Blautia sp.]|nr:ATP-dependent DNA helicase [Blautia sp.]
MEVRPVDKKPEYRVSVRNLVEFILRSGDIDTRRGAVDLDAMQKGARLHRKIQKSMGKNYRAEVMLRYSKEFDDLILKVEGRADGIFEEKCLTFIDEIKGLASGVSRLTEPVPVHLAQAKCYAAVVMLQEADNKEPEAKADSNDHDTTAIEESNEGNDELLNAEIGVQMTYADLDTEEKKRFREILRREELEAWFEDLLKEYHKWLSWRLSWIRKRNASIKGLSFPFSYREGQKKLAAGIYHTISGGKQIFIQAPTGIGKTMAAVFPSVISLGEGRAEAVFYLTARTTTRTVAEESFRILAGKGLVFKTVTITAKEKMCRCDEVKCDPEHCLYARGYEDRVNDAVFELLQQDIVYDREAILEYAVEKELCPFEFTLDLSLWVDGIICDYNYVFDPDVCLKRFFGEGKNEKYIFLIDEAHNLADRSREMYSARISRKTILAASRKSREKHPALYRALNRVNRNLRELEKELQPGSVIESCGALPLNLLSAQGEIEKLFEDENNRKFTEEILDEYFEIRKFTKTHDLLDDSYVIYTENDREGKLILRLFCVNPAHNLSLHLTQSAGTVFFSATLLPMRYFRKLLSIRDDDYGVYVPSPFPPENRLILTCPDVSSRYKRRGYEEYRRIAEYISTFAEAKKGNYMIFFPSYAFMDAVKEVHEAEFSSEDVRVICQTPEMDELKRTEFLEEFNSSDKTLAAFCTMGGIFSEGIDLTGDRLIGAAIVGPGIPQVSTEREILKDYYAKHGEDGYDYAYRFPGMNKVLQAAGRVIRTETDVGAILLLDDRFISREYGSLMPPEWSDRRTSRIRNLAYELRGFWEPES